MFLCNSVENLYLSVSLFSFAMYWHSIFAQIHLFMHRKLVLRHWYIVASCFKNLKTFVLRKLLIDEAGPEAKLPLLDFFEKVVL